MNELTSFDLKSSETEPHDLLVFKSDVREVNFLQKLCYFNILLSNRINDHMFSIDPLLRTSKS